MSPRGRRPLFVDPRAAAEHKCDDRTVSEEYTKEAELEPQRIKALERFSILDSAPEQTYDDITKLASLICGTPISLISFVDKNRQWFKSEQGLGSRQTRREDSFCAHTIPAGETLVVNDAAQDERFRSNPLVLEDPHIRFYAGAPIIEKNGHVLGTVCVIDEVPRTLSSDQLEALEALARQVVVLLEQREIIGKLERAAEAARLADLEVRQARQSLQTFVDAFPALAWIASSDGWITWYNRRWFEYTGTTKEDMEGWGWQSVHDPSVLPEVLERWTASIRTGTSFEMVFPLKGADGIFRPFLTRVEPLRSGDGAILQWFGSNVEVDALERANLELRKSRSALQQVLHSTSDAIVGVDRQWNVSYMNPEAEKLYGAAHGLIGRGVWECFAVSADAEPQFKELFERAMYEDTSGELEAELKEPVRFTLGLEAFPSEDGIVTFSRDITKLKLAAAALMQNEKLAAVGRLASSISHEINNPLEAVTNLLYLARNATDLSEADPFLKQADVELRRVSAITSQTLRFHRQSTRPTQATFLKLVEGVFTGQHSRLTNFKIKVNERNRAMLPILCLEGEIRQVLHNLIGNGIDAMAGGGGTLYLRGRDGRNWRTGQHGMIITIADTGSGMSDLVLKRVFDAFYTTKGIGGTGLGLWISKEIIDRHSGSLSVKTSQQTRHHGSVMRLFLPSHSGRELQEADLRVASAEGHS